MAGPILLAAGLALNVTGICLGSSRDLGTVWSAVAASTQRMLSRGRSWILLTWRRMLRRPGPSSSGSASISAGVAVASGGTGHAWAWNPVPDDDVATAVVRLRERDETLREMIGHESNRRCEDVRRLESVHSELTSTVREEVQRLNDRIDDFDVKPAGQRGLGAVLVVCGTIMMTVGGILQQAG